jgi:serine/threonine-protein kinase
MTASVSPEFLDLQAVVAGRYSLERELGRGGMGIVLLARDVALDRLVAIKLLPPELAPQTELRDRFLREARTAAGLSHPHIVPIHAVEEHGDLVFFVMGYVDGETLRERVERHGPLTPRATMKLIQEVAWALGYAHSLGVVHRDIKPENIMIERATGRSMVTDFGIASIAAADAPGPSSTISGTARYMSPEQATGEDVDARSDLYSLGVTAFFALTGKTPFDAPSAQALVAKHVTAPPPSVTSLRPEVSGKLAAVIDRCLAKAPDARYASAEELARAVGAVRGRELRAPPLVRNFLRNAEVSTAAFLTAAVVASGANVDAGGVTIVLVIVLGQLGVAARKLLQEGYAFDDIRAALLAEAEAQDEEAEAVGQKRFFRRVYGVWHRIWAGGLGRRFFKIAGYGLTPPARPALPSADPTEVVLGRSVVELYESLPSQERKRFAEVPEVIRRLEHDAETLRQRGDGGERLESAVAALENLRLGMLRLRAGTGTVSDLTADLSRAREIGDRIDAELEVRDVLKSGVTHEE